MTEVRGDSFRRGFTLLEMCMVLFIIMLLAAAMLPAIESTFAEEALRGDAHQLALMVKTGMIQSNEQHRDYVMEVSSTALALHPAAETPDAPAPTSFTDDGKDAAANNPVLEDVTASDEFNSPNKLMGPDPQKPNSWIPQPTDSWLFQPGALCPAPRVRMTRGEAWLEMSFNALTGNVEDETAYFP